jgi:hypothetical protein
MEKTYSRRTNGAWGAAAMILIGMAAGVGWLAYLYFTTGFMIPV